jgi:hypothetical protein
MVKLFSSLMEMDCWWSTKSSPQELPKSTFSLLSPGAEQIANFLFTNDEVKRLKRKKRESREEEEEE